MPDEGELEKSGFPSRPMIGRPVAFSWRAKESFPAVGAWRGSASAEAFAGRCSWVKPLVSFGWAGGARPAIDFSDGAMIGLGRLSGSLVKNCRAAPWVED